MLLTATNYMDSETSEAFAKVLEYIVNSLGKAVENNGTQVMEYLQGLGSKIVAYKCGIAYLWLGLAALLALFSIVMLIVCVVKCSDWSWLAACLLVVTIIVAMVNAYDLIECYTFPEKTVIDYITKEYNSMSIGVR